jgi:hypothetical protein
MEYFPDPKHCKSAYFFITEIRVKAKIEYRTLPVTSCPRISSFAIYFVMVGVELYGTVAEWCFLYLSDFHKKDNPFSTFKEYNATFTHLYTNYISFYTFYT